ncbi:MAG: hypothetical protein ACREMN_04290 [Gemmatimonadales bacterium]
MRSLLLALAVAVIAACGDAFPLLPPSIPNEADTLSLYALHGTPITSPSAIVFGFSPTLVRTDRSTNFDFAFDIDTAGRALLFPTGAIGLGRGSGTQVATAPFDSLVLAPAAGYDLDSALVVTPGSVVLLRSRPSTCNTQLVAVYAYYAKLLVLAVDTTSGANGRRIDLQILINQNCGYRRLDEGLPGG